MTGPARILLATWGLALLALGGAAAAGNPKPTVLDPLPFDHAVHGKALGQLGLQCTDCHGFEAPPPPDESARPLIEVPQGPSVDAGASPPVPLGLCHGCHQADPPLRPSAPRSCALCHPVRDELRPSTHDPGWTEDHGRAARRPRSECGDCHEKDVCVACHEQRGALARDPHGPGFRATHGIEARLDPGSCDTCHTGESCTSCHTSGGIPW
jgi:hypothetical protein